MDDKLRRALAYLGKKYCLHPRPAARFRTKRHHISATFDRARRRLARTGRAF